MTIMPYNQDAAAKVRPVSLFRGCGFIGRLNFTQRLCSAHIAEIDQ